MNRMKGVIVISTEVANSWRMLSVGGTVRGAHPPVSITARHWGVRCHRTPCHTHAAARVMRAPA
jgi:hypothetical protein